MKRAAMLLVALLLGAGTAAAQALAFTHVTVIDVAEGVAEPGRTVVIEGDRIVSVGLSDEVEVPAGAIPGLWDMHTHSGADDSTRAIVLPLFVAHGVTGVRELSGLPGHLRLRDDIAEGRLIGPRMVVGSPLVDGPNPWPAGDQVGQVRIADPEEGRIMVDSLSAQGWFTRRHTSAVHG